MQDMLDLLVETEILWKGNQLERSKVTIVTMNHCEKPRTRKCRDT